MTEQTPATDAGPKHGGTQYLLVGGAALATMAFVVGLWMLRGGSVDLLLGEEPATAAAVPVETSSNQAQASRVPQAPRAPHPRSCQADRSRSPPTACRCSPRRTAS